MLPLTEVDLDRLSKLLGRLGSNADAERALAGLKADALLRERGSSWSDVVAALKTLAAPSEDCHRAQARQCLSVIGIWSDKELAFLLNIARRRKAPTPPQARWLGRLVEKARIFAREAA